MDFWYALVVFIFLCNIVSDLFDNEIINKSIFYVIVLIFGSIAAFRNYVGYDFEQYVLLYRISGDIFDWYQSLEFGGGIIEPTVPLMCGIFKNLGLSYQAFIIAYASITIIFIVLSLKSYLKSYKYMLIAISLFLLNRDFYFASFSIIRQAAAVSIAFYISHFLLEKKTTKFYIGVLCSMLFHFSAIVMFLFPLINKISMSKRSMVVVSGIICIIAQTGVLTTIYQTILSSIGVYGFYLDWVDMSQSGGVYFAVCIFFLLIPFIGDRKDALNSFLNNMAFICTILLMISFSINMIYRLCLYVYIFYIISIPYVFNKYKKYNFAKYIVYMLFSTLLITNILGFQEQSLTNSKANIEYRYNLEIFE